LERQARRETQATAKLTRTTKLGLARSLALPVEHHRRRAVYPVEKILQSCVTNAAILGMSCFCRITYIDELTQFVQGPTLFTRRFACGSSYCHWPRYWPSACRCGSSPRQTTRTARARRSPECWSMAPAT